MDTVSVLLPNGQKRMATYRNGEGDAGYVRVSHNGKETTVSGSIIYDAALVDYRFSPRGKNASLVR